MCYVLGVLDVRDQHTHNKHNTINPKSDGSCHRDLLKHEYYYATQQLH